MTRKLTWLITEGVAIAFKWIVASAEFFMITSRAGSALCTGIVCAKWHALPTRKFTSLPILAVSIRPATYFGTGH